MTGNEELYRVDALRADAGEIGLPVPVAVAAAAFVVELALALAFLLYSSLPEHRAWPVQRDSGRPISEVVCCPSGRQISVLWP